MKINARLTPASLTRKIARMWELSARKITDLETNYDVRKGSPVFTVRGKYTARGWTEWTQGFQYGGAILQFDATGDTAMLEIGRRNTVAKMAPHVSHFGVHDHGFNNVSTYGNLLRLMNEGRLPENGWERNFYELALKISGAAQARRWSGNYIYSFNGPHSLFVDTIRSLRSLALAHQLGHVGMEENDRKVSLLDRLKQHGLTTAKYSVFYGEGRDAYDVWGRTTHEAIFNVNDGNYRCPNSQQGYSPFSTWTRGLAWAMLGFPEQIEYLGKNAPPEFLKAAKATCDFYIDNATASDGIPYWDTGAPLLHKLGNWQARPADPYNQYEPVDSSAAAIGAQGLLRLGRILKNKRYWQAGLTVLDTLLNEPYLSTSAKHQGLLLHSVYHRPNGWDCIPAGQKVPCGESSMWGDYHLREAALYVQRIANNEPYYTFFS
ncbi:MAG: Unsaturated chondroitin disaccharide hydrolase [Verrucomicrobiae bacterium]|nr:Unsaturated chondroitin disaccharide hydrolase [Verrucomicrobiae bacterium]